MTIAGVGSPQRITKHGLRKVKKKTHFPRKKPRCETSGSKREEGRRWGGERGLFSRRGIVGPLGRHCGNTSIKKAEHGGTTLKLNDGTEETEGENPLVKAEP